MTGEARQDEALDDRFCRQFAEDWIAAWNSHDIQRILSHYDESFEFTSPILAKVSPRFWWLPAGEGSG